MYCLRSNLMDIRLLFWITFCGISEAFFDANSLLDYSKSRVVRQAPPEIDLNSLCSVGCLAAFGNSIDSELENMQQASGTINPQLYDQSKANKFCGAFRESQKCNDLCSESRLKRLLLAGLAPLDYLCVDHFAKFQSLSPCFNKSLPDVMKECDPKCGGVSAVSDLRDEAKSAQERKDLSGMKAIMGKLCDLLRCRVECEKPVLEKVCGSAEPGYFMQDFAIVSMKGTEEMLMEAGAENFYPTTCKNFAADLNAMSRANERERQLETNRVSMSKASTGSSGYGNSGVALKPAVHLFMGLVILGFFGILERFWE